MIDIKSKLARAAWDLGPISKSFIPTVILNELMNDFQKQNKDVEILSVERIEELNTYTVTIRADERLELYADWMATFEVHGYEAPFLVVDKNGS